MESVCDGWQAGEGASQRGVRVRVALSVELMIGQVMSTEHCRVQHSTLARLAEHNAAWCCTVNCLVTCCINVPCAAP